MTRQEPTEEEMRAAMEEQLRQIRVEDVVLQTVATLVNLAGRRLGLAEGAEDERDLDQARIAIEATRALLPLLSGEEATAVRQALSQLQMAFAREAQGAEEGAAGAPSAAGGPSPAAQAPREPAPPGAPAAPDEAEDEAERAKARSRIWTPPGT